MSTEVELRHVRMAQTEEHLMKKLDRIFTRQRSPGDASLPLSLTT